MKAARKLIHVVKHLPTGAKVPVIVNKVDDKNVIQDYQEHISKRKGFTLRMLEDRWDKIAEEVIEILQKYQIPAHINHKDIVNLSPPLRPVDVAIFFEEYIYAVEQKAKINHNKLKSRTPKFESEH